MILLSSACFVHNYMSIYYILTDVSNCGDGIRMEIIYCGDEDNIVQGRVGMGMKLCRDRWDEIKSTETGAISVPTHISSSLARCCPVEFHLVEQQAMAQCR